MKKHIKKVPESALPERKKVLGIFLGVFLLSLAVKLVYFSYISRDYTLSSPILDAKYYNDWAIRLAANTDKSRGEFVMSPGYSYFISVIYRIKQDHRIIYILQIVMDSLLSGILLLLGLKAFDLKTGVLAALLYIFYAPATFYSCLLVKASFINFFNIAGIYLFLTGRYFTGGMLLGYSTTLRPNVFIFIAFLFFYLLIQAYNERIFSGGGKNTNNIIRNLTRFSLGLFVFILPVVIKNYQASGKLILSTAHGGMNFYTGNHPDSAGYYKPLPFARSDPQYEQEDFLAEARRRTGKNLTYAESSDFWYSETFRFITARPGRYLLVLLKKVDSVIKNFEQSINYNIYYYRTKIFFLNFLFIPFGAIAAFSIYGIIKRKDKKLSILKWYVLLYTATLFIFFSSSEYRFPLVPALVLFAAAEIFRQVEIWRSDNLRSKVLSSSVICLIIFVSYFRQPPAEAEVQMNNIGTLLIDAGKIDEAIIELEKAVKLSPDYADPLFNLGTAYNSRNNYKKAIEYWTKALEIKPHFKRDYFSSEIGIAYGKTGKLTLAEKYLTEAYGLNGNDGSIAYNLGNLYLLKKDFKKAEYYFERAVRLRPDDIKGYMALGIVLKTTGRLSEAISMLKDGIGYVNAPELHNNLGIMQAEKGNIKEAVNSFTRALEINPNYREAYQNYEHAIRLLGVKP